MLNLSQLMMVPPGDATQRSPHLEVCKAEGKITAAAEKGRLCKLLLEQSTATELSLFLASPRCT